MKLNQLSDVLLHQLQDAQSAEQQLVEALPKMVKAAKHPELKAALSSHLEQTKRQLDRVTDLITALGGKSGKTKCVGMTGIVKEGDELIKEDGVDSVKDAALITAAQRVEHYEIAVYGSAKALATLLGHDKEARVIEDILEEEHSADEILSEIAEIVNAQALEAAGETKSRG
jgi:ferritin-like metal-binding protein YciE